MVADQAPLDLTHGDGGEEFALVEVAVVEGYGLQVLIGVHASRDGEVPAGSGERGSFNVDRGSGNRVSDGHALRSPRHLPTATSELSPLESVASM